MESLIDVQDLTHTFGIPPEHKTVLKGVSTRFRPGEIVIIAGPSGTGKTTFLTLMAGLRTLQRGSIKVCGRELFGAGKNALLETRREIGFIFQSHNLIQSMSVLQNVQIALAFDPGETIAGSISKAMRVLEQVGMADHARKGVATLSGGQKQRVAIARGLVRAPSIILADEPIASLDKENARAITQLLRKRSDQGCSIIIVTHDEATKGVADRVLYLDDGLLTER